MDVSINPSHTEFREPWVSGGVEPKWRRARQQNPLNQHDRSSYELTDTEGACPGPAQVYTTYSSYIYDGFQLSVFKGFLSVSLIPVLFLGLFSSSLSLPTLMWRFLFYLIIFYFVIKQTSKVYYYFKKCKMRFAWWHMSTTSALG